MMKCTACGRESDEGFPYCPWCGSKTATTDDVASARRIAAEEKLRHLRRAEIAFIVLAVISLIVGGALVIARMVLAEPLADAPAHLHVLLWVLIGAMFVLSLTVSLLGYRKGKQREDFVRKLEKGRLE